jgi:hypothetical protein
VNIEVNILISRIKKTSGTHPFMLVLMLDVRHSRIENRHGLRARQFTALVDHFQEQHIDELPDEP